MIGQKQHPEIVIGLVGPIGCDIDTVQHELIAALRGVNYDSKVISLSSSIADLMALHTNERPTLKTLKQKIEKGNLVRQLYERNGILAVDAIRKIRAAREEIHTERKTEMPTPDGADQPAIPKNFPAEKVAYIIRQLKKREEVDLLERIYGKQFIQVSITHEKNSRLTRLADRAGTEQPELDNDEREQLARDLVRRDENEEFDEEGREVKFGQKMGEIFHLADVFINSENRKNIVDTCRRFTRALFGDNSIAPTIDEFGSSIAKAASLRSVDTSRQVGAAIVSKSGDLLTIGCNEVPKPGGGNYWDEDDSKARDVDKKAEANKTETNRIVFDFIRVLHAKGVLAQDLTPEKVLQNKEVKDAINDSLIGDITEYGRMVHAEMNALSDAARLGRSVIGATLYVTTFPCHNCAKHIIAAGIDRIVFIEPYPKSRTELLYSDAIATSPQDCKGIHLDHFNGISPKRFRDIFEKGKRRSKSGEVLDWYEGICKPRLAHRESNYTASEETSVIENLGKYLPEEEQV